MVQSEPVLLGPDNTLFGRRDLSPFIGFYRPFIAIYRFRVAGEKKVFLPPGPKMFQSEPVVGDLSPFIGFHRGFIAFYRVSSGIYRLLSGFIGDLSPCIGFHQGFIAFYRVSSGIYRLLSVWAGRGQARGQETPAGRQEPPPGREFLHPAGCSCPRAVHRARRQEMKPKCVNQSPLCWVLITLCLAEWISQNKFCRRLIVLPTLSVTSTKTGNCPRQSVTCGPHVATGASRRPYWRPSTERSRVVIAQEWLLHFRHLLH